MKVWTLVFAGLTMVQRVNGQTWTPEPVAEEADSVARTAGLPVELRSERLAQGDLELRAYVGFGSAAPGHLVRIERRHGHVTGELILWWAGTTVRFDVPDDPERPIAEHDQEVWAAAMRQRARRDGLRLSEEQRVGRDVRARKKPPRRLAEDTR